MKIAFTTSGETLDSPLDSRFGRAPKFLVYDLDKNTFVVIDNGQNLNAAGGAGVQAAETIALCLSAPDEFHSTAGTPCIPAPIKAPVP